MTTRRLLIMTVAPLSDCLRTAQDTSLAIIPMGGIRLLSFSDCRYVAYAPAHNIVTNKAFSSRLPPILPTTRLTLG